MRSLIVVCSICIILINCKTNTSTSKTNYLPAVKIKNRELPNDAFVLEKEEDFEKIEKSFIIYIKLKFGSREMNNDCNCPELEEKYILFRKENISYIQKVVGNAVYYPVKLNSNVILNLYSDSFSELKNETVKKFRTMQGDQVYAFHRTNKKYILAIEQDKPITINFSEEDFQQEDFGEINANYAYNKNLIFYKIDSILNSEINELNKQNAFIFRKCRKN